MASSLKRRIGLHSCIWGCALFSSLAAIALGGKNPSSSSPVLCVSLLGIVALFVWQAFRLNDDAPGSLHTVSSVGVVLWISMFFCGTAIIFPVFQGARAAAEHTQCVSAMKQTSQAVLIYIADFDDRYPPGTTWRTGAREYGSMREECPKKSSAYGYAYNEAISRLAAAKVEYPAKTVMVFEAESATPNAFGSAQMLVRRHGDRIPVGHCDGSARIYNRELGQVRWEP